MQPKLTIQERLKDLRVERGLTLEQLSACSGARSLANRARSVSNITPA